jgi:galactose mutarotase-like enzyme
MKARDNLLWPASVFGTLVGRFAGRISRAKFLLDGANTLSLAATSSCRSGDRYDHTTVYAFSFEK